MNDFLKGLVFEEKDKILFPSGIPGFEDYKDFVIVQVPDYQPFEWLVCTEKDVLLRFAILNPMLVFPDYNPKIVKEQLVELHIEKPEDILLYTIVTIREDPSQSTVNLIGPVIVNKNKKLGKQIIIDDDRYSTQESILRKS